jgi:hypothetical protein
VALFDPKIGVGQLIASKDECATAYNCCAPDVAGPQSRGTTG